MLSFSALCYELFFTPPGNTCTCRCECEVIIESDLWGSTCIIYMCIFSECLSPTPSPEIDFSPVLDNYTAGSTLTYTCRNVNWTLIGESVIVCQNDGQWSSEEPKCKCKYFWLHVGYNTPFVVVNRSTFCNTPSWSMDPIYLLSLLRIKPYYFLLKNMIYHFRAACFSSQKIDLMCMRMLFEENHFFLFQNGWTERLVWLPDVTCEELVAIANGGITYDNSDWPLLPGTTAVYSCQASFELQGPETRICETNGSWTGPQEQQCISKPGSHCAC